MSVSTPSGIRFAAIAVSVASIALLQNLVIPVIPLIQTDLGASADAASWTMTAWLIAAAVATPLLGRVGDLAGRRRTFLAVLAVVALGDVVALVAPDLTTLLVGRVLQGVGGALFPLAFGLVRDTLPPHRVTGAIGATSAVIGIGGAAGSVLAGPLADAFGWRTLFALPLVIGALGFAATRLVVPAAGSRARGRVNLVSAALLSAWLIALLVPLSSGSRWGWGAPPTIGLFVAAAVLLAAWVVAELRAAEPLVDIRMLLDRAIWPTNLAGILVGAAAFGFWGYLPQFLQVAETTGWGLGLSAGAAGLVLLPLLVGMSAVGFATGALSRLLPLRALLGLGAGAMGLAVVAAVVAHAQVWQLAVAGGVFGVGIGLAYAASASIIVQSVPADRVGVATGMNANLRTIGSAMGSAVTSAIVFGQVDRSGAPRELGYDVAWIVVASLALAAAVVVGTVRTGRRSSETAEARRREEGAAREATALADAA
ncbi:MFS transporter [Microbacterium sp. 10M-3C3]|jgi:MFS family permease|uniref:MFS transporter n=1 Tax=Microbacterium sp. 10M-3C3 TaxID=2483401 RepID=UPI000F63E7D0|nr:MFS transporter [Microbacterium sp. 10M-3C3]